MLLRICILALMGLAGQAAAQLVYWTTEVEPERMAVQERIAADYEAATGVEVTVVAVQEGNLARQMVRAFGARQMPDVVFHPLGYTLGWAAAGVLDTAAAGEVIRELGVATFHQETLDLTSSLDGWSAVPATGWVQLLLYRQDLFEAAGLEAPVNVENIALAIEALHDPPHMYGFVVATEPEDDYMMQTIEMVMRSQGATLFDPVSGEVAMDNYRTVNALEFYDQLASSGPGAGTDWRAARELYLEGRAAMTIWSSFIMDELAGAVETVPVPFDGLVPGELASRTGFVASVVSESTPSGVSHVGVNLLGITADADTVLASDFVRYLMDEAYLDLISMAPEGSYPLRRGTEEEPGLFAAAWSGIGLVGGTRPSLQELYPELDLQALFESSGVAGRLGYLNQRGAFMSLVYSSRVLNRLVASYLAGEQDAAATALLMQQAVEALE